MIEQENKLRELKDLLYFPKSIFKTKLTVFESIVYYLKEERNLSFKEISIILNRDERNIWTVYNRAKHKAKKWLRRLR